MPFSPNRLCFCPWLGGGMRSRSLKLPCASALCGPFSCLFSAITEPIDVIGFCGLPTLTTKRNVFGG